jgi:hypothetical protein
MGALPQIQDAKNFRRTIDSRSGKLCGSCETVSSRRGVLGVFG